MKTKHFGLLISFILITILFSSCNPAEDKRVITHTIVTDKNTVSLYEDSISKSKVICKLKPGDEVFHPDMTSNGMASVALYKYGPQKGYIDRKYISSDTTIITHSSVLRDEYGLVIVPYLDETLDSVAQSYLDFFPIKKANFWIFAIVLAIGIGIFYGISDIKVPIGVQLLAFVLASPFALWIAFNIQQYDMTQIDGFFYRLIILLAFLVLTVLMLTALTASVGKLIGHNLTFKSTIWGGLSVFLIYFGVAYIHGLSDFFFKFGIAVYAAIMLYYVIKRAIHIKRDEGLSLRALYLLLSYIAVLLISVVLINIIMIPMQVVSSILITQLLGAFMVIFIAVQFLAGVAFSSSDDSYSSSSSSSSQSDGSKYEHEIYGGLTRGSGFDNNWYDENGRKYEETSPGRYRRIN